MTHNEAAANAIQKALVAAQQFINEGNQLSVLCQEAEAALFAASAEESSNETKVARQLYALMFGEVVMAASRLTIEATQLLLSHEIPMSSFSSKLSQAEMRETEEEETR